jgi:hypothetical protein
MKEQHVRDLKPTLPHFSFRQSVVEIEYHFYVNDVGDLTECPIAEAELVLRFVNPPIIAQI